VRSGSGSMRAVRWHGRFDVRVEDVPKARAPGPHEVRVRVAWCGLCGSDLHEYRSGPFRIPLRPHPVTGQSAPIVLGHEISGWVDAIGSATPGLREGDLVALNALLPCGTCRPCLRGDVHLCLTLGHLGMSADGGLAELLTVPAAMVVPAPAGMRSDVAALAEPFAVAVRAIGHAGRPVGASCVVIGAGAIGLAVAIVLRAGGNTVTLLDIAPQRLRHAGELGFQALDVGAAETITLQAPVVFECSGADAAPDAAFRLAEPGGLVVLTGLPESPSTVDFTVVVLREVHVVGSMSHLADADMAPALSLLAEHAEEASRIVTARVPLGATVEQGLEVLAGPERARHAKMLVRVCADA
jgi:(R,R)-butanediol dehydrogenase/meso-butanediol dehydrogenase/diacetyl reductase